MRPLLVACLAAQLAACRPSRDDTPEGAYRAFVAAANKGDAARAFARLTPASQALVTRRLAGLAVASGGSIREDPAIQVFSGGSGPPVTAVSLLKKDQDRATVQVTTGDQKREVTLLRQGSEWRVELSRAEPAPPR
jgi:hypothetical protein